MQIRLYQVLLQQPEVNATKKATLIGHSEGTTIVPRVAVENPDKVKNIGTYGAIELKMQLTMFNITKRLRLLIFMRKEY